MQNISRKSHHRHKALHSLSTPSPLDDVEALAFNVFGTVADYYHTISRELLRLAPNHITQAQAEEFVLEWRRGYFREIFKVAGGSGGTFIIDEIHRNALEEMLQQSEWSHLGALWDASTRDDINMLWHKLDAWPDVPSGIRRLKEHTIVATLSDGNVRLLLDMAKHNNHQFEWDAIICSEFIGTTKPNPKMYIDGCKYLNLPPSKCAMVAAILPDLQAAAKVGMKTIYIRRPTEDSLENRTTVKSKAEGGEVDIVVDSLGELADLMDQSRRQHAKL